MTAYFCSMIKHGTPVTPMRYASSISAGDCLAIFVAAKSPGHTVRIKADVAGNVGENLDRRRYRAPR